MVSFPQPSPPTSCAHLYPPPYTPHALPISLVELCALAAIKAHVKKPFAEPLNVNVCSFLNILSSALVRTNRTGAAACHVSRRANSSSSPAPWAQLRARRQPFNSWTQAGISLFSRGARPHQGHSHTTSSPTGPE